MTNQYIRIFVFALLAVGLVSCGKKENQVVATEEPEKTLTSGSTKTVSATPVSRNAGGTRDRLHQSFTEAVRGADDPPPGDAVRPPDETITKKPVHRILDAVRNNWDEIRFTTAEGKKLNYRAMLDTSEGPIEIVLFPEQAPNHVRNFIALAKTGYYDGLFFDRIRHDRNERNQELHLIEAGCPLGTGAIGTGSIGYWLKEEFTPADKMGHEEGIVGACRGEEADTAATRFYITLTKAPFLDGNYTIFGKVVTGLDVLRKIGNTPVIIDDEGGSRPAKPILIRQVTITSTEANSNNGASR